MNGGAAKAHQAERPHGVNGRARPKSQPGHAQPDRGNGIQIAKAVNGHGPKSQPERAHGANGKARPGQPEHSNGIRITRVAAINIAEVTAVLRAPLRTHKFQVGQTVFYTSSPISRPGASGSYQVVRLLPSDGDDYQYRIKNPGEAFERVAKESQLDVEG